MHAAQQLDRHLRLKPLTVALTMALAIGSVTLPSSTLATDQGFATTAATNWQTLPARASSKHGQLIRSLRSGDGTVLQERIAGAAGATEWREKMLAQDPEMKARVDAWRARNGDEVARDPIIGGTSAATSTSPQGTMAVLPVTSCDEAELRSVISGAADGDTIDLTGLSNCTISLSSGAVVVYQDNLVIQGPGAANLTIDANHDSNVFGFAGTGTLTITGATLTGGFNYGYVGGAVAGVGSISLEDVVITDSGTFGPNAVGAGVFSESGNITLVDSTVTGTTSVGYVAGAAVFAEGGQLTLSSSTVTNNHVTAYEYARGGGAFAHGTAGIASSTISGNQATGKVTLGAGAVGDYIVVVDSVIVDNHASGRYVAVGGGIVGGDVAGTEATIAGNTAVATEGYALGGGIYAARSVGLTVATISGNAATAAMDGAYDFAAGGGIYASDGQGTPPAVDVKYSSISDNNTSGIGGGIVSQAGLAIANSTISGNHAGVGGGGAVLYHGETVVQNSTITKNSSTVFVGGGIVSLAQPAQLQSSIIFGNLAAAGYGDLYAVANLDAASANNIIGDAGSLVLPGDTITSNPMLGPLQDNGGLTKTHAIGPGSPAIDAGNNTAGATNDQRGPGFPRVAGPAADIGAFEYDDDIIFVNGFD